jgi:hypothetical protein
MKRTIWAVSILTALTLSASASAFSGHSGKNANRKVADKVANTVVTTDAGVMDGKDAFDVATTVSAASDPNVYFVSYFPDTMGNLFQNNPKPNMVNDGFKVEFSLYQESGALIGYQMTRNQAYHAEGARLSWDRFVAPLKINASSPLQLGQGEGNHAFYDFPLIEQAYQVKPLAHQKVQIVVYMVYKSPTPVQVIDGHDVLGQPIYKQDYVYEFEKISQGEFAIDF